MKDCIENKLYDADQIIGVVKVITVNNIADILLCRAPKLCDFLITNVKLVYF